MTNGFRRFADVTGSVVGSPWAFTANIALTALWLLLGPVFGFSDTWQLTMNTAASQVTFLIAFLLQNTQNRDTKTLQLKLDELLRSSAGARPQLMHLEGLDDDQLEALKHEFERLRERKGRTTAPTGE
ncbi:MAG TPA: low affinity iron permease family protein [Vicinamibacterales bacterium]|nr:low affinity iron permease family protein [Vicinamibacterales bacterium]